jgi:hypothetical protein
MYSGQYRWFETFSRYILERTTVIMDSTQRK